MIIYFILGAFAVVYLVFFRKKPATFRAAATSPALSAPAPVSKLVSPAAQIVKVRLGLDENNRPITISLNKSQLVSSYQYAVDLPRLVQVLEELSHVYLLVQVATDEEESIVYEIVEKLMPQFPKHHCLLYSLEVGKVAIVRQVIPSVHIEFDRNFCEKLKPHVRKIIWVDGGSVGVGESAVPTAVHEECNHKLPASATTAGNNEIGSGATCGFTTVASFGDILRI